MSEYIEPEMKSMLKTWQAPDAPAEAKSELAPASGSAMSDAQKLQKAIEFLQWIHDNCLAPDITAHDAITTCSICRLIVELKAPNQKLTDDGQR